MPTILLVDELANQVRFGTNPHAGSRQKLEGATEDAGWLAILLGT